MIIEKLNAINAILFLVVILFESIIHGKKKKGESEEEFKIRDRKEACMSLGIFFMMIAVYYIAGKSLAFFTLSTLGFLAYCLNVFFKTIYYSLKKDNDDISVSHKNVLIAQFVGLYLIMFLQEFNIFSSESKMIIEIIMILEMFFCYSISIFFILNDLHIVMVDSKEYITNRKEKNCQKQDRKRTKINFYKFEIIEKRYEESYKKIDACKNKVIRSILYKLQFLIYVLLFSTSSLVFFFAIYPLSKIKELFLICINFLRTKFMELFSDYKFKDMYRYSRISMIISMIFTFVVVNNDQGVSAEIKNILEILTTVILIPVILESMQNIKEG